MSSDRQPKSRSRLTLPRRDHPKITRHDHSGITPHDHSHITVPDHTLPALTQTSIGDHQKGPKPVSFEVAPDSSLQPDCPVCHLLCLSPTVLPCGHLICRKCVRRMLEDAANRAKCANTGYTANIADTAIFASIANTAANNTIFSSTISTMSTANFASSAKTAKNKKTVTLPNSNNTANADFSAKAAANPADTANTAFTAIFANSTNTDANAANFINTANSSNAAIFSKTADAAMSANTAIGSVGRLGNVGTAACPFCGCKISRTEGQTVRDVAERLGKDVVMEDVVLEVLIQQGEVLCTVCPHKPAVTLCLDCRETYCADCCLSHKRMAATGDHLQEDLAKLRRRPPMSLRGRIPCVVCPDRIARNLCVTCRETYCAACSRAHRNMRATQEHFQEDLSKLFQTPSSSSVASDSFVGDEKQLRRDLKREAERLKEGVARLEESLSIVRADVAQLRKVENTLGQKQQLLAFYMSRLKEPDEELLSNAKAVLTRLKRLRKECHPPPEAALISVTRQVIGVLHLATETGTLAFDPMTDTPIKTFSLDPVTENDSYHGSPMITSIVFTTGAKLVMADFRNKSIKVADLNHPEKAVLSVSLDTEPGRLALLWDGQVAAAAAGNRIYFVDVTGAPTVTSHIPTVRNYQGITSLVLENALLASCQEDEGGPASLDILSQAGVCLKTIVSSRTLSVLSAPLDLCVLNQTVWVADWHADAVFKVGLETGTVLNTYTHPDLSGPTQVVCDSLGNCYVVSCGGLCLLVISPDGKWRRLLPVSESLKTDACSRHSVLPVFESPGAGDSPRQGLLPISANRIETGNKNLEPFSKNLCFEVSGSQLEAGGSRCQSRVYPRAMCVTDWGVVVAWDGCTRDGSGPGSVIAGYKLV